MSADGRDSFAGARYHVGDVVHVLRTGRLPIEDILGTGPIARVTTDDAGRHLYWIEGFACARTAYALRPAGRSAEAIAAIDVASLRQRARVRDLLEALRRTIVIRPEDPDDPASPLRADFHNFADGRGASAIVLPLLEAAVVLRDLSHALRQMTPRGADACTPWLTDLQTRAQAIVDRLETSALDVHGARR